MTLDAVVLGPGGLAGTAWMIGLVGGLRREGVDLADAGLVVGTSAGAIVGAMLTGDLDRVGAPPSPEPGDRGAPPPDPGRMAEVFAVLGDRRLDPAEARRRVGRIALDAGTAGDQAHIARMGRLIGARQWPEQRLLIAAVDAESGEPVVWDRASGVPLVTAVAASTAMPGAIPPIPVDGRRYIDGALRAGTNADLAAGARTLVVVEPLAHLFPSAPTEGVRIVPDAAAVNAFGPDLFDRSAWAPAHEAGARQAVEAAERIHAVSAGS
jgi:NTE family protein